MIIFFDANAGDGDSGYILWFPQSIIALNGLPDGPQEGLEVDLCMPEELTCRGKLIFDNELGYWKAIVIPGTTKLIGAQ
jgi:hypothetical protein